MMSEYAAGLNMILTYYHFQDDSADEKSKKAWAGMQCYKGKMKKASKRYQRQDQAVRGRELTRLHQLEQAETKQIS